MPVDYEKLNRERDWQDETIRANKRFVDMYGDPTHFIFELIQNAEDALGKRLGSWRGSRTVSFNLLKSSIRVQHFGRPFDKKDVEGITVTLKSTKEDDLTQIGKFGVGFKSVFSVADRPTIHSGDEDFGIENFIISVKVKPLPNREREATVFLLPLNENGKSNRPKLADRLEHLEPTILLFLRQVEEITCQVSGKQVEKLRRETHTICDNICKATIARESGYGQAESTEQWIVFTRPVDHEGKHAGYVEIAFQLSDEADAGIQPLSDSPLTVYFPTIVKTNLGFLIQGPYQTTLNRENVPWDNCWNKKLMAETACLVPEVLRWLRDNRLLDAKTLNCFPIRKDQIDTDGFLAPLYDATKAALESDALLPCLGGVHRRAAKARLGSTDAVRQLLTPARLAKLYGEDGQLFWISDDITEDRTPELRRYIRDELGVIDVTPERIVQLLRSGRSFLELQPDEWIRRLYEFLGGQPALLGSLKDVPLLRLDDGRHIEPNSEIQAFLPGQRQSQFPTLRKLVCNSEASRRFLESLGLREPHPVDDVIKNVLPKYEADEADDTNYEADIELIAEAYKTDAISRKNELVEALQGSKFVKTMDAADGSKHFSAPNEVFLATERQRELFVGVQGVLFLDESPERLNSQDFRRVLEECGATPSSNMADIVVRHILPKYVLSEGQRLGVSNADYERDIECIWTAYENIPNERRFVLLNALRNASFIRSVDAGTGTKYWSPPASVYLPTDLLKELFDGVEGVYIVNDAHDCLRREAVSKLLEDSGAAPCLQGVPLKSKYSRSQLSEVRRNRGLERATWEDEIQDSTLRGVDRLLQLLPDLSIECRQRKGTLLWRALVDVANDSGYKEFQTTYQWGYYGERKAVQLDTAIVRKLNETPWIPDANGELQVPARVYFQTLRDEHGWEEHFILANKIHFKPPIIAVLAHEAGIEAEALDLMQKHGLTADDLRELISMRTESSDETHSSHFGDHDQVLSDNRGEAISGNSQSTSEGNRDRGVNSRNEDRTSSSPNMSTNTPRGGGQYEFRSYIAVATDEEADLDGMGHSERLDLEKKARQFILDREPEWQEAKQDNPGFDLYKNGPDGKPITFCEVKAMSTTMANRPATMTRTQFEKAQTEREAFWLYVVENTDTDDPRIVRIQDPAGKAQTFTFDEGWGSVAVPEA